MSEKTKGFLKAAWCKFRDALYSVVITSAAKDTYDKLKK